MTAYHFRLCTGLQ